MSRLLNKRFITVSLAVIMVISMIPVVYLTFFNHSTGDDLGYATNLHAYLQGRSSFSSALQALIVTVKEYYVGWQGTWFSVFLFALQPAVFGETYYSLVTPGIIMLWFGSTFYFLDYYFKKKMGFYDSWQIFGVTLLFLFISYEYIPSTAASLYWYNGIAHYMIPFSLCQIVIVWIHKFQKQGGILRYIGIMVFMTLLGGSSYQNAMLVFLACLLVGVSGMLLDLSNRNSFKRSILLLIPLILETVGGIISAAAPGNKVRGGEEFGFSIGRIITTILKCFPKELEDITKYVFANPIVILLLVVFFAVTFWYSYKRENPVELKNLGWTVIIVWLVAIALQAPELYAGVPVSGGVFNMNYQMIIISLAWSIIVLAEYVASGIKKSTKTNGINDQVYSASVIVLLLICVVAAFVFRSNIKKSVTYRAYDYIASGQAHNFKMQMEETDRILNSGEKNVTVPSANSDQGPLMHMPIIDDPNAFTNAVTAEFYGLESVVVRE